MADLVPNIWAGVVIPMPFAVLALVLRLKARRMTKMGMGYDDCFSVAAWLFAIGYSTIILIWAEYFKLGQEIGHYRQSQIDYIREKSFLILWISEFFYSWSIFLSKIAVLTLYRRMFQLLPIRWPILILMVACVVWILTRTFATIFRCSPVRFFWDRSMHGHCTMNVAKYYFATDLAHTMLEVLILTLPIFEVSRMKLPFGQKVAVIGLFACGFCVCIASVFQIIQSQNYNSNSQELPYQMTLAMVLGSVEVQLAIFASCLVLLRPIVRKFVPGLSTGNGYGTSRPSVALHPSNSFRNTARNPRNETSDSSLPRAFS
ncbi:hypothetical protein FOPG_17605 [Fusarium oxysporum f. sp. conglutinans race 2 54008]|uniref:Rhodopsin domain-containing protein n=1 Tax=Fusarium oxysporum f. sp. conglutinans race 2 54008 TaxID=1089457 RepID=X0H2E2_FUSOX|nr:hypothetical protein FOPG_17605 [Fusarium oxysporum f. sp. conglutinans race 2 54008]KAG6979032.1 hypothetical protein FocnCong_v010893 [Fusarium oxysporum f. sp. conglutinans]